jgi:hypothetical protein
MVSRRVGLAFTIATGLVAQAGLAPAAHAQGIAGDFTLKAMTHTPDWPNAEDVMPWDGVSDGSFRYRAIPCTGNAPLNNISSNLPTYSNRIPGARSPASTRAHPMVFTVEKGVLKGKIDFTVCKLSPGPVPASDETKDPDRPKIIVEFTAKAERLTPEEVVFKGDFMISGGTGRYEKLTGSGIIAGYMFCYDPKGCVANQGRFRDMQFGLQGVYSDPAFKP